MAVVVTFSKPARYTPSVLLYLRNLVRITLDFVEQGHVQFADENPLTWYLEEFLGVSDHALDSKHARGEEGSSCVAPMPGTDIKKKQVSGQMEFHPHFSVPHTCRVSIILRSPGLKE